MPVRRELSVREIYNRLKRSAKKRGIAFSLTLTDLNEITFPLRCPILGIPLKWNSGEARDDSYSFDRIDSSKGYDIDNLIVVSWRANRLKNNGDSKELRKISDFYAEYAEYEEMSPALHTQTEEDRD